MCCSSWRRKSVSASASGSDSTRSSAVERTALPASVRRMLALRASAAGSLARYPRPWSRRRTLPRLCLLTQRSSATSEAVAGSSSATASSASSAPWVSLRRASWRLSRRSVSRATMLTRRWVAHCSGPALAEAFICRGPLGSRIRSGSTGCPAWSRGNWCSLSCTLTRS